MKIKGVKKPMKELENTGNIDMVKEDLMVKKLLKKIRMSNMMMKIDNITCLIKKMLMQIFLCTKVEENDYLN